MEDGVQQWELENMMELGVMGTGRWMMEWGWMEERKMDDGVGGQVIARWFGENRGEGP